MWTALQRWGHRLLGALVGSLQPASVVRNPPGEQHLGTSPQTTRSLKHGRCNETNFSVRREVKNEMFLIQTEYCGWDVQMSITSFPLNRHGEEGCSVCRKLAAKESLFGYCDIEDANGNWSAEVWPQWLTWCSFHELRRLVCKQWHEKRLEYGSRRGV